MAISGGAITRTKTCWISSTSSRTRPTKSPARKEATPPGPSRWIARAMRRSEVGKEVEAQIMRDEPLEIAKHGSSDAEEPHADDGDV